ncbi:hypothetical protein TanjilG_06093 [Lupinus angustifolius]|uniref:NAC-A/B domain-containing protein n=1 Tax=Lupinus angustifolius TaxID=3871 RepID=A0A4P1RJT9_LUPAN|nr:hypothetical protein TanjilG_06093 [Lupinus angustifolius]
MLDENNVHAKSFRIASERLKDGDVSNLKLKLIVERNYDGRINNLPTASKVIVLIVGDIDSTSQRGIILETQSGQLMNYMSDIILFVISKPDVFKSPASDTYIIFGEAKIEDLSSQLQTQAAEQFKAPNVSNAALKPESSTTAQDDEEDVDETGVDPKDIDLVLTQAGVSRSRAVKALKAADGDIVAAIMELTN